VIKRSDKKNEVIKRWGGISNKGNEERKGSLEEVMTFYMISTRFLFLDIYPGNSILGGLVDPAGICITIYSHAGLS
jgi:hypothetical protein